MPDWQPNLEVERRAARSPLRRLTTLGYFQSQTVFCGVSALRRCEGPAASCTRHCRRPQARPRH